MGTACERQPQQSAEVFYNLDSLINAQVKHLVQLQPSLEKVAVINGESETVVLTDTDSAVWAREFQIFRQLDLNARALNAEQYRTERGRGHASSNLAIIEYTATQPLPLSFVRIYYQDTPGKVRRIEGEIFEENRLYASDRLLSMEFIDVNGHPVIVAYEIRGAQKMFLGDSVNFSIKGALTYE